MFAGKISSWRQSQQIEQIKGNIANKNKSKLFEDAVNYILTSHSTAQELIDNIMWLGDAPKKTLWFSSTYYWPFDELSIYNNYFFNDSIITYLLIICYLKYTYTRRLNIAHLIEPNKIKEWLNILGFKTIANKLKDKHLAQISITEESIHFMNPCCAPIKLSKLIFINNNASSIKHTKKAQPLHLKNMLYHNHDANCLGATNYWLEQIAKSYAYPPDQRNIKKAYIQSLETTSVTTSEGIITSIRNKKTQNHINQLQNGVYINDKFKYIHDIYTTNLAFNAIISKLFTLMHKNSLSKLYIQLITHDHAMGMAIIVKGNLVKILAYDPNDTESYMKITITPELTADYQSFFNNMPYFKKYTKENTILLLRCQAYMVGNAQLAKIPDNEVLLLERTSDNLHKVLHLAIVSNNEKLVSQLANKDSNPYNLIVAVQFNHVNIVKILIDRIPSSLQHKDENGYTALYYARALNSIRIMNLLQSKRRDTAPINTMFTASINIPTNRQYI